MDIEPGSFIDDIRLRADDAPERLRLAVAKASELRGVGDAVVTEFVDECRRTGHGWEEIASVLSDDAPPPFRLRSVGSPRRGVRSDPAASAGVREHTGKYRPIWEWLSRQDRDEVSVSFQELEAVLGFSLPRSCREHLPHWYGYEGSAVARAIIDAGWRAHNVDLAAETVTLTRVAGSRARGTA